MIAGSAIGAAVGSLLGPVGTMIGGMIGGMAGEKVGTWVPDWGGKNDIVKIPAPKSDYFSTDKKTSEAGSVADFRKANEPAQKITEVPKADGFASLRQTEETVAKVAATKAEATATQLAKFDAIDQKFGAASPFQHSATYNATADFYKQQRTDREVDLSR